VKKRILYAYLPAAIILFLDQFTKYLVERSLYLHQTVRVIGDFARITFIYNERGLFGFSFGPNWIYYLLPFLGVFFVLYLILRTHSKFYLLFLGIILGGGLGNIVDRFLRGRVVDFIDMGIGDFRWYTFNVADASIVVSVIVILLKETFFKKAED